MDKIKQIAQRIKELRLVVGKTPEQMAASMGITANEYLQAESGKVDFGFTFLYRCGDILGVDVSELVSGTSATLSTYQIIRHGEGLPLEPREGFSYFNLASLKKDKLSQPYLVIAKHSEQLENSPISLTEHAGEEFDFVLNGRLKVQVGDKIEFLEKGDSIYYDSSKPHGMVALGQDCEFLAVVMHSRPTSFKLPHETRTDTTSAIDEKIDSSKLIYNRFIRAKENDKGELVEIEYLPTKNFNFAFDVVDEIANKTPKKRAMLWLSRQKEEKTFTFDDMKKLSSQAANFFISQGIKKGDKVMLVLQRHHQFWPAILALHKIGAIAVPATHLLTQHDFEYRFNEAGISAIVATPENDVPRQVELADGTCNCLKTKIIINESRDGWISFDEGIRASSQIFARPTGKAETKVDDIMIMYFTSGTTGYPKISAHDFTYPLGHLITAKYWHQVEPNGLHLTIADTGWAKSVWGKLYGQWLCEAAVLTYDFQKWDSADILTLFKKYNITTFCAPPTMYRFFIKEDLSKFDLSSLKHATIAGEALNPEVYEQFHKATGLKLMEGYGQTEATLLVLNLAGMTPKPGSMGRPSPGYNIDIINSDGNSVKPGEPGEIVVRVPKNKPCGMFCGYYSEKTKSFEKWDNGIYHTKDEAWRDEEGYFWYVGRTDDVIKSAGYRIGPFEVESVLMEIPYILECAVTGAPDPIRGQVVKATVVLTKGTVGSEKLKQEIQDYVKSHTAPYKYPRFVEFVPALPKTISGKIRRIELKERQ